MKDDFQLGITQSFPCNYLPDQQERLIIAVDQRFQNNNDYSWLMNQGFRRSGDQIYRPHCEQCNACQSIRVISEHFKPSKSQKRLLKRNQHFTSKISKSLKPEYFDLYERYINTIHKDGAMYPATQDQYQNFLTCTLSEQVFIEIYHEHKLISLAVTDLLVDSLSAVYTFYDPDYRHHGLGVFSILKQIETCQQFGKQFLYLGYQIDACQKMNYKDRFYPHQRLVKNQWIIVNK